MTKPKNNFNNNPEKVMQMVRGKKKKSKQEKNRNKGKETLVVVKEYDDCPKCGSAIIQLFGDQLACADCGYMPDEVKE
ncbi:MAG: hypothetical protein WA103_00710 [Minisyncoccales bacterium]